MADVFNEFFENIGPKFVEGICSTDSEARNITKDEYIIFNCSLHLRPVTINNIERIIQNLINNSAGIDNIKAEALKFLVPLLAAPLA